MSLSPHHQENYPEIEVLRTLIAESPIPIGLYVGREMRIKIANKAMLDTWGRDETVIGETFREAFPGLENQPFANLLDRVYTTGIASEAGKHRANFMVCGELRVFDFTCKPLKDAAGNVWGVHHTATDVSELVLGLEVELETGKQLQQRKDDFIGIASHELKTPLTALKGSMQLLNRWVEEEGCSPRIRNLINLSDTSIRKLNHLLGALLNDTRISEGQLLLHKTPFTLADVVDECCSHVRVIGEYTIVAKGDLSLRVNADAQRIDQVVVNFVNNAIKYAPKSKEIVVLIERIGDFARLSVIDRGPGIPADKLPHLFKRYYRVDTSGVQYAGLGLGLFISAEIIRRHGGDIGVESEPGQGSTFWFAIPIN